MTSGESLAREGKYAFRATVDAPKPMFAHMASRADKNQTGDDEGSRGNNVAEIEPNKAKKRRIRLRCEATSQP